MSTIIRTMTLHYTVLKSEDRLEHCTYKMSFEGGGGTVNCCTFPIDCRPSPLESVCTYVCTYTVSIFHYVDLTE